jgi:hypothetical protein
VIDNVIGNRQRPTFKKHCPPIMNCVLRIATVSINNPTGWRRRSQADGEYEGKPIAQAPKA